MIESVRVHGIVISTVKPLHAMLILMVLVVLTVMMLLMTSLTVMRLMIMLLLMVPLMSVTDIANDDANAAAKAFATAAAGDCSKRKWYSLQ